MLAISTCVSLALLGVGVIGLVDAYAGVAAELERMREDALAEADQRAATVEQLGAHVAHELKNPLTAVRGLVQLVARKTDDRKQAERLAVVEAEVDRVLDALRGYLSFTKPVTELRRQDVDVRSLLEEVSALVEARAASRGVVVSVRGESVVEKLDPRRMRDAVLNLALNAMDAMPGGGHLELEIERLDGGLRLVVRDDGVGVAKDLAGRLGEPYASRSEGGTGLGVLIATGIVRQHGGALSFESSEQAGTRVTIELPAAVEGRT
jgi:signal transduction histidine kinase